MIIHWTDQSVVLRPVFKLWFCLENIWWAMHARLLSVELSYSRDAIAQCSLALIQTRYRMSRNSSNFALQHQTAHLFYLPDIIMSSTVWRLQATGITQHLRSGRKDEQAKQEDKALLSISLVIHIEDLLDMVFAIQGRRLIILLVAWNQCWQWEILNNGCVHTNAACPAKDFDSINILLCHIRHLAENV